MINAESATRAGVNIIKGKAPLISKFLIASITNQNAIAPRIVLPYRITKLKVDISLNAILGIKSRASAALKVTAIMKNLKPPYRREFSSDL